MAKQGSKSSPEVVVVLLRDLHQDDLPTLVTWFADPATRRTLPYREEDISLPAFKEYLRAMHNDPRSASREVAVMDEDRGFVGRARLSRRESPRGPCGSFECLLGPEFQGQGLGRVVLPLVEEAVKVWAGSEVIQIAAFEDNHRALSLYRELLGYQEYEREWWSVGEEKRRVILLSNLPSFFVKRRMGF